MNTSPADSRPRHKRGYVLYMDLVGYRALLSGKTSPFATGTDPRQILMVWYTILQAGLDEALADGTVEVAYLFSDSVFAFARSPEPLFQACDDVMRALVGLRSATAPLMARGAIAH